MTVILDNDSDLPPALYNALVAQQRPWNPDPYSITVTELIAPARARALLRQAHESGTQINIPASRRVAAFMGTCLHAGLEPQDDLTRGEQRLHAEVTDLLGNTWMVSGQPDLIDENGVIHDYKLVKAYSLEDGWLEPSESYHACLGGEIQEFGGNPISWCGKEEWIQQLNLYAELASRNDIKVNALRITAFVKDYRERSSGKWKSTHEEMPWVTGEVTTFHVEMWLAPAQFLRDRLTAHADAMAKLPTCSSTETWGGRRCAAWCDAYQVCSQANPLTKGATP